MTFQDIFTSEFLDRMSAVPPVDALLALVLACCVGLFVLLVYRRTYAGVMYSPSFGAGLVAMTLITTLVILAVSSNVLLSLGMVGALSIVRFRTPVKEPMDIVFIFWCIAEGIVLAAGLIMLALVAALFIGLVLLALSARRESARPYVLVVRCGSEASERAATEVARRRARSCELRSKSVSPGAVELNFELRLGEGAATLVDEVMAVEGVADAMLVSYDGEYMG